MMQLHEAIRERMTATVVTIAGLIPPSRERSMFITLCQQAQMMANAALAIHSDVLLRSDSDPPSAVNAHFQHASHKWRAVGEDPSLRHLGILGGNFDQDAVAL